MSHQVLEEYNSLPTTQRNKQGDTKLLKLLSKYLLMMTFENSKNYKVKGKGKGSPYSNRALGPELIPVIGSPPQVT